MIHEQARLAAAAGVCPAPDFRPQVIARQPARRIGLAGLLTLAVVGATLALQGLGGAGGGLYGTASRSWGPAAPVGEPVSVSVWVVRPGDTLWSIAEQSRAAGDPRAVVDWLSAEVGGRPLQAGERVVLPPTPPR
jgi:nucleoid-associated protein YgaU